MSLDVSILVEVTDLRNVFDGNITHNLGMMAGKAGIYELLWRPEELGYTKAKQLIKPLEKGLLFLQQNQTHLEQFNPPDGWGNYHNLCTFVQNYLDACRNFPNGEIKVNR